MKLWRNKEQESYKKRERQRMTEMIEKERQIKKIH